MTHELESTTRRPPLGAASSHPRPALPTALAALAALAVALAPASARAHCDTLDGPVAKAGEAALRTGDASPALAWVQAKDEGEIRDALRRAVAVRKGGDDARRLADTWFLETLVRVHRAGEGAPFTGLLPAGQDLGPAVPAADAALASGDPKPLVKLLDAATHDGLHARYTKALEARRHAAESVAAGRRFVAAYVDYVHYVERLHDAAKGPSAAHGEPDGHAAAHGAAGDAPAEARAPTGHAH